MLLSKGPTLSEVVITMANDQHPPLYFVGLHYWIALLGNAELITRLYSVLWSVLGVAVVYRFGADIFRSWRAGVLAAILLALADNDIMLAQETRHYTQMATLVTLCGVYYWRYYRSGNRAAGLGWWASGVALIYTHYLGVFILGIQFLHTLFTARPFRKTGDLTIRLGLIGLAWLPWAFVFYAQSQVRYTRPILFRSSLPNTPETFTLLRNDLLGSQYGVMIALILLGLVYIVWREGHFSVRFRPLAPALYAGLWLFVPIISLIVINARFEILTPRNFLLITPAIALLAARGLSQLDTLARRVLLVVIIGVGVATTDAYFVKPPWRAVSQDILRYQTGNELVLMDVWVDDFALRYHLGRDLKVDPVTLPLLSIPEWLEKYTDQFHRRLLDRVSQVDALWLVQWSKDEAGLVSFLAQHGFIRTASQLQTHLGTNLIHIWRYDRLPVQPPLGTFGDQVTLVRTDYPTKLKTGTPLRLKLWWQALASPKVDYSVSAFLLNAEGRLVAQQDSSPLNGKSPMSSWKPGDLRFDQPEIPQTLPKGVYTVAVKVYWYVDGKPLPVGGNEYLKLGEITIHD